MCGIAGIMSLDGHERPLFPALADMSRQMYVRGPDDEGYLAGFFDTRPVQNLAGDTTPVLTDLSSPDFYPRDHYQSAVSLTAHMGFAFRRLAIIDLSPTGHQPMCTRDGRFWIIFNGEIYNASEIRRDLADQRIEFVGHSDTEVLLYAHQTWGPDALKRCNGMFAFAIWDNVGKTLFCARDRIGIKPFYYTITDGQFIFASDIKTLIASKRYQAEVDPEGLYHAMSYGVAPRPMTAFKGVRALEQGHWLHLDGRGHMDDQSYWRIPTGMQDRKMSELDAIDQLRSTLTQAVARRLIADVPVGTFMSGGIDSTTITAIAADKSPGITAFTLAFASDEIYDELPQAQATAAMHPVQHVVRSVNPDIIIDHIEEMTLCYEEPYYSLSPNYVISQLVSEHGLKVILAGLGGDELFAGYSRALLIKKWRLLRRIRPLLRVTSLLGGRFIRPYKRATVSSADRLDSLTFAIFDDVEKHKLFKASHADSFNSIDRLHQLYVPEDMTFSDDLEAFHYMEMMNYVGNHHVYRTDQFTMRFSLEGRFPFFDHELVELAFRIPSEHKIRGNIQKYVLRKVAEPLIHPSCLDMEKKGFSLPVGRWMNGPLRPLIEQKLKQVCDRDLFNQDYVWKSWQAFQEGRLAYESIWQIVAVELWLETFFSNSFPTRNGY